MHHLQPQEIGFGFSECITTAQYRHRRVELTRYAFARLVDAVHHLHSQGVAHNDICPENVIVTESAEVSHLA